MTITYQSVTHELVQWVALPRGVRGDGRFGIAAFVSPRLYRDGDGAWRWSLGEATSFSDWPASLASIDLHAELGPSLRRVGCEIVTPKDFEPESAVWTALFDKDFIVESFGMDTSGSSVTFVADAERDVMSYSPRAISSLVKDRYTARKDAQLFDKNRVQSLIMPDGVQSMDAADSAERFKSWGEIIQAHRRLRDRNTSFFVDRSTATAVDRSTAMAEFLLFHSAPPPPIFPPPTATPVSMASGMLMSQEFEVGTADNQALFADPRCENGGSIVPTFVLPSLAAVKDGFTVTIKSLSKRPSFVRVSGTDSIINHSSPRQFDDATNDVVYRATRNGWLTEQEGVLDFHAAMSALAEYPALLRKLGIVIDLALDCSAADLKANEMIRIVPCRARTAVIADVTPWTRYEAGARNFSVAASNLEKGLLKRESKHMVIQTDDDTATLKLALSLDEEAAPALRHAGIALVDDDRAGAFAGAVQAQRTRASRFGIAAEPAIAQISATQDAACVPPGTEVRDGVELLHGFRIDVRRKDKAGSPWRSLCGRSTSFRIPGLGAIPAVEEGKVSPTADLVGDQTAQATRVSSALFRWDGWSLSIPRPSRAIGAGTEVVPENATAPHPNLPLDIRIDVPQKPTPSMRLERLRFGGEYEFRARAVDIAGNSLTVDEANGVGGKATTFETRFSRFEPVQPPTLIPLHDVVPAETNTRLVIRSFDNFRADNRQWLIASPKVSAQLAEMHGALDHLDYKQSWLTVKRLSSDVPNGIHERLRSGPNARGAFRYLRDPLCRGVAFHDGAAVVRAHYQADRSFIVDPAAVADLRLEVSAGKYVVESLPRWIRVQVPAGRCIRLRVTSTVDRKDAELLGLWRWRGERNEDRDQLERGQLELITPPREVEIVHAVQRPLIPRGHEAIEFDCVVPRPRELASTSATLDCKLAIDVPSSGKIDMEAAWIDPVDDPRQPGFTETKGSARPFQEVVPKIECRDESFDPVHAFSGVHKFTDTKHHLVTYTAAVTTRFADNYAQMDPASLVRRSAPLDVHILSTRQPAVAEIYYAVPTFSYAQRRKGGTLTRARATGLRIYLRRGHWWTSGGGEMLAIILPRTHFDAFSDDDRKKVTEWAMDPIWRSEPLAPRPLLENFTNAHVKVPDIRLFDTAEDGTLVAGPSVAIAAYNVAVDPEKNLLYCDVDVDAGTSYFPFLRLAVARYQPFAEEKVHLSSVRRAVCVQIVPGRTITAKRIAHNRYHVSVSGAGYLPMMPTDAPETRTTLTWKFPFPHMQVGIERERRPAGAELSWVPVPESDVVLEGTRTGASSWLWQGEIVVPFEFRRTRLVVREYEHFPVDVPPQPRDGEPRTQPRDHRRVTYLDTLDVCDL